jgi:hypothetical protein
VEADIRRDTNRLRVCVGDPGSGHPVLGCSGTDDEHGRGMQLVAELAVAYGCEPDQYGDGKRVWFELELEGLAATAARPAAAAAHRWTTTDALAPLALQP